MFIRQFFSAEISRLCAQIFAADFSNLAASFGCPTNEQNVNCKWNPCPIPRQNTPYEHTLTLWFSPMKLMGNPVTKPQTKTQHIYEQLGSIGNGQRQNCRNSRTTFLVLVFYKVVALLLLVLAFKYIYKTLTRILLCGLTVLQANLITMICS